MKRLAFFLVPAGVTAAALLPFFGSDYLVGFFFNIFLFVTMACGWNLISG